MLYPSDSTVCRSPRLPGAWIDATGGRSPRLRLSLRPHSGVSQSGDDSRSFRRRRILPRKYDKSENLNLELWDPHRLAAHVMATLSLEDERVAAVNFILEKKITGAFLVNYTHDIEAILLDENSEIVRAISRTLSRTFWIQWREHRPKDLYKIREIVRDIDASKADMINFSATRPVPPSSAWEWAAEEEKVEAEVAPSYQVDPNAAPTDDGRSGSGSHRVWAWFSHLAYLPRSTFEDWGATFTFLSGLVRGWRDVAGESDNAEGCWY